MNSKLTSKFFKQEAFTLVELLATIVIIALLVGAVVIYIPQFISWSRQTSDKQTLAVLNDALTRYKTEGGGTNAFTISITPDLAIAKLSRAITWAGRGHQVLKTGQTYPAHSLSAVGTGASYTFIRFNSYVDAGNSLQRRLSNGRILGDIGGKKSSDGSYFSPDGILDNWDLAPFLQVINDGDPSNYLTLNTDMTADEVNAVLDFNQDTGFDGTDIGPFVEALENPTQYNIDYPPQ
jgi:prepilin-type N-terminal cleavage/methylation domain-containing protein